MNHEFLEQLLLGPRSTISGGKFQVQIYFAVDTYLEASPNTSIRT